MVASPWLKRTPEGEKAVRLVNRLSAIVARSRRSLAEVRPKRKRRGLLDDLNQVAVVRAWSIVDAYLVDRPDAVVRQKLPVPVAPSDLVGTVHAEVVASMNNFNRQADFWRKALGVDLKPYRARLDEFRILRNVVVHGAGYVRPRFGTETNEAVKRRLRAAGITSATYAGPIPISEADVTGYFGLVREFIEWADGQSS